MEKLCSIDFLLMGIQGQKVTIAYSFLMQTNRW